MTEKLSKGIFIDPHISLKDRNVKDNLRYLDGYPMFGLVEFNIWGACNRRCSFCPVSDPEVYTNKVEGIELEDYLIVLNDLKRINYSGVILWSMFSEPTLHKRVFELATLTKDVLPNSNLQLTSNGDTIKRLGIRLRNFFDSGVDRINFSLYDGPEQFDTFTKLRIENGLSQKQMVLRRRYREDGNYGITISNRAGLIESNQFRDEKEEAVESLPLNRTCNYPFYQMGIDYNGDVLLCPHDWSKDFIIGNAFKEDIWSIWKNKKFEAARKSLAKARRSFNPCKKCDVKGDLIGKENFNAFQNT